jgi:hypothetical protein
VTTAPVSQIPATTMTTVAGIASRRSATFMP